MTISTDLPADSLVMFSTTWCGYCQRLKAQMGREGIEFTEIDIETQPEWADFVAANNGGNHTVPTLRFPDGSVATNPPIGEVKRRLGR